MRNQEKIERGRDAARLIETPVFREALDRCMLLCQARWISTGEMETEQRETIYHQLRAINSIEEMLNNFVEEGLREEREEDGD